MTAATDTAVAEPLHQRRRPFHVARLAFRRWRHSRPFWAGLWSMLGGLLIAYVPATAFKFILIANASIIFGILVGALIGFFGLLLWFLRSLRILLGILILVLSLGSFFTSDFGGLILGMLMGLIGGSLALAWVPTKVTWRQRRRARRLARAGGSAGTVPEAPPDDALPDHTGSLPELAPDPADPAPAAVVEQSPPPVEETATLSDLLDPPPEPVRQRSGLWRFGRRGSQAGAD